jgi:hypothetical protein
MPGDGSLQAVLVAQPELPGAAIEQAGTKIYTSGASFLGRVATKAIYLPVWRKVSVDMAHIAKRHITGGAARTARRTVFPSAMDEASVMRAVRHAYESSTKIGVQGTDRIYSWARVLASQSRCGSTR